MGREDADRKCYFTGDGGTGVNEESRLFSPARRGTAEVNLYNYMCHDVCVSVYVCE